MSLHTLNMEALRRPLNIKQVIMHPLQWDLRAHPQLFDSNIPIGATHEHVEVVMVIIHIDNHDAILVETKRHSTQRVRLTEPAQGQEDDLMIDDG